MNRNELEQELFELQLKNYELDIKAEEMKNNARKKALDAAKKKDKPDIELAIKDGNRVISNIKRHMQKLQEKGAKASADERINAAVERRNEGIEYSRSLLSDENLLRNAAYRRVVHEMKEQIEQEIYDGKIKVNGKKVNKNDDNAYDVVDKEVERLISTEEYRTKIEQRLPEVIEVVRRKEQENLKRLEQEEVNPIELLQDAISYEKSVQVDNLAEIRELDIKELFKIQREGGIFYRSHSENSVYNIIGSMSEEEYQSQLLEPLKGKEREVGLKKLGAKIARKLLMPVGFVSGFAGITAAELAMENMGVNNVAALVAGGIGGLIAVEGVSVKLLQLISPEDEEIVEKEIIKILKERGYIQKEPKKKKTGKLVEEVQPSM